MCASVRARVHGSCETPIFEAPLRPEGQAGSGVHTWAKRVRNIRHRVG